MEVAMELEEDDAFFADLSKQISLLIMDDDDDDEQDLVARCPSVSLQVFSQGIIHPTRSQRSSSRFVINDEQTRRRTSSESKGTGVFIPRGFICSRKKNKQGRLASSSSSNGSKLIHKHHQIDDNNNSNSIGLQNVSYNNNKNISYADYSFNSRRF